MEVMEASLNFSTLAGVDKETKLIVCGYIRECERFLDSKQHSNVIPSLVIYICVWYYHTESFHACSASISLNRSDCTAICTTASRGTVFGKYCAEMKQQWIYVWVIQILGTLFNSMDIGICCTNDPDAIGSNFSCGQSNYGSYSSGGRKNNYLNTFAGELYGKAYNQLDIIQMHLNTNERTLSFYKNGSCQGIAFHHLPMNKKYYLAISLGGHEDTVKLIDFYRININEKQNISQRMLSAETEHKTMKRKLYKLLKHKYPRYAKQIVTAILKETTTLDIKRMLDQRNELLDVAAVYKKQLRIQRRSKYQ